MAAFSRGLLIWPRCSAKPPGPAFEHSLNTIESQFLGIRFIGRSNNSVNLRSFSSASHLRAKKLQKSSKTPQTPLAAKPSPTKPITTLRASQANPGKTNSAKPNLNLLAPYTPNSYISTLAAKPHPTLLYQAPSHTMFMLACYSTATFCISYAGVVHIANFIQGNEGLPVWVPYAYSGIAVVMAGFGAYVGFSPARIVKSITAIPSKLVQSPYAKKGTPNPNAKATGLQVEVELRKMLPVPFFPARKLIVRPDEIVLPQRLFVAEAQESSAQIAARERAEKIRVEKLLEYDRNHIMTRPFRDFGRAISQASFNFVQAIQRMYTREGFLKLKVKKQRYKLDVTGGWALDKGKAMDRLFTIKPEA
ncbi:hypothetical protein B0O99DRAFT_139006 [Bisporella sp. PMI_857]|nr:hypothetical protein B0O99DRAFT_139006 [Bisporella sp. PMI_857]